MVSLINHEYSRREAHGRLAWQSMPSNGLTFSREPREDSFRTWIYHARGSTAATWCSSSSLNALEPPFFLQLMLGPPERAQRVLPLWCFQTRLQFRRRLLRQFAIRNIRAPDELARHSIPEDIFW